VAILAGQASLSRTASAAAADLIRQAIIEGRVVPGQRLKEEELAQELQAEGLVEAAPNRGATVRAYELADLGDMYELRALLEGQAARRAAGKVTAAHLEKLRSSCDRFELLLGGDLQALVKENAFFHETILGAAGSERLTGMVHQVVAMPLVYKSYIWYSPEQVAASYHYHRQLTHALERRDAERAELIMREHVYEARDVLVQHMETATPAPGGVV
jgi:DNA-binding GntR family transcriptional regulator